MGVHGRKPPGASPVAVVASQEPAPPLRAPAGLGKAGGALWRSITTVYDLAPREAAILAAAARQADAVASLEALVLAQGLITPGSNGQPRLSAAVTEARQGRLALGRLLGDLALPDVDGPPMTARSQRAQHAANARWARKVREEERRGAASA